MILFQPVTLFHDAIPGKQRINVAASFCRAATCRFQTALYITNPKNLNKTSRYLWITVIIAGVSPIRVPLFIIR
ncbi:hypothetical protein V6667_08205 [Neisseria leonii]|uniref:Uncharacterized protein n=1 Tax=Neisseria leonii TaxID=2995413 RepID=A0A9X4IB49_9NEIS|nr:hypothetical protein [Neisseria sp. 51.81]MDD9328060.1 hypothetical protein [Neisseria sp. 51.81]